MKTNFTGSVNLMTLNVERCIEMNCKNCIYFPCLKFTCSIGNKEGCAEYKSIVQAEIENIDRKIRNDANEEE